MASVIILACKQRGAGICVVKQRLGAAACKCSVLIADETRLQTVSAAILLGALAALRLFFLAAY
ncbi:MAG: hypothetical protein ACK5JD_08600 [Mangrovibacterium sp.]